MCEQPSLLHNMSAPPKSVVSYSGLGNGAAVSGPDGRRIPAFAPGKDQSFGTAMHFCLDPHLTASTANDVLRRLGMAPGSDPDVELADLLDARAAELPLPDGCLVIPDAGHAVLRVIWPDLLSVLAVLSKCSEHVWLRAKTPSLSAALTRRTVTLYVPPQLQHHLPEENA